MGLMITKDQKLHFSEVRGDVLGPPNGINLNLALVSNVPVSLFYQILHRYQPSKGNTVFSLNIRTLQFLTLLVLKFEHVHLHVLPFDVPKITRLVALL